MKYSIWLAQATGMGLPKKLKLLNHFKTAKAVYHSTEEERISVVGGKKASLTYSAEDVQAIVDDCNKYGIKIVTILNDNYPEKLRETSEPPIVLYYKGDLQKAVEKPTLAFVGTRKPDKYGEISTDKFAYEMALSGATIVSGLADGCDGIAHKSALRAKGSTIAVLGFGICNCYPQSNYKLKEEIAEKGVLISEYPPKTTPQPAYFRARNRIIAGLSDAIIVTQAKEKSGTMITARNAVEYNRMLFAVPANVTSVYLGTNGLIRNGAFILSNTSDITDRIDNLSLESKQEEKEEKSVIPIGDNEVLVLNIVRRGITVVDEIIRESKLSASQVMVSITMLELTDKIRKEQDKIYLL